LNLEEITVNQEGNYLLFFNAVMTSTVQRANLKVSVWVNGAELPECSTKSFHIRASRGTQRFFRKPDLFFAKSESLRSG
jgi:hypothetical protein